MLDGSGFIGARVAVVRFVPVRAEPGRSLRGGNGRTWAVPLAASAAQRRSPAIKEYSTGGSFSLRCAARRGAGPEPGRSRSVESPSRRHRAREARPFLMRQSLSEFL